MRLAMPRLIGVVPTLRKPRRVGHPQSERIAFTGRAVDISEVEWQTKIADSWALNSAVECHPHTLLKHRESES